MNPSDHRLPPVRGHASVHTPLDGRVRIHVGCATYTAAGEVLLTVETTDEPRIVLEAQLSAAQARHAARLLLARAAHLEERSARGKAHAHAF